MIDKLTRNYSNFNYEEAMKYIHCFDKIYYHLIRKHGDKDITIDIFEPYQMMKCDWNEYHLAITHWVDTNKYDVWLENNYWVFKREQEIGTKFWQQNGFKNEEEVIDYIKSRMKNRQPKQVK